MFGQVLWLGAYIRAKPTATSRENPKKIVLDRTKDIGKTARGKLIALTIPLAPLIELIDWVTESENAFQGKSPQIRNKTKGWFSPPLLNKMLTTT
jgi:hypothetical protein